MSDLERHDRRLVLTQRVSPRWRIVAVVAGAIVVHLCIGFFLEVDFREVRDNVLERLSGVFVAMAAIVGASALLWGLFAPDRILTFDGVRRIVEIVERRPLRRSRATTRSFDTVASVDVVYEGRDDRDAAHVHLVIRGEKQPLVVREFLERSDAEAIVARLRAVLLA